MKLELTENDKSKTLLVKFVAIALGLWMGVNALIGEISHRTAQPEQILAHPHAKQAFMDRAPSKPLEFDLRSEWDKASQ